MRLDSQRIAAPAAEQKALANRALNDNVQPEDLMRLERGLLDRLEARLSDRLHFETRGQSQRID